MFGQDRASIISEIDSVGEFGVTQLKEYLIDRVECHRENLFSSNLNFENCLDNIIINDQPVSIDYSDSKSIIDFQEKIKNLKIKEFIVTRQYLNDTLGWTSTININYIENETALIERIAFEEFQVIVPSSRHKVNKRKQNGELIEAYLTPINYLDIHSSNYSFKESNMEEDEMIVWTIYGRKTITLGFHVK